MEGSTERAVPEGSKVGDQQLPPPVKRSCWDIERSIRILQQTRVSRGGMTHPVKETEKKTRLAELYLERAESDGWDDNDMSKLRAQLKGYKQDLCKILKTTITVLPDKLLFKPYIRREDDHERAKECAVFDFCYNAFLSSSQTDCFCFNETVELYRKLMKLMATSAKVIVYGEKTTLQGHSTLEVEFRTRNIVVFLSVIRMKELDVDALTAFEPFSNIELPPFTNDRYSNSDNYRSMIFELSALDICRGVEKAMKLSWLDFDEHDLESAKDTQKRLLMNRITPHFYALAAPGSHRDNSPKQHLPFFQSRNIKVLVKLTDESEKEYDPEEFEDGGVKVVDISFRDGGLPTKEHVNKFLALADEHMERNEPVAVHCAMGWGRTGVLICTALISRHGFTAREAIGYIRFMRWQTVQRLQQPFLERIEKDLQEHRFLTEEAPRFEDFQYRFVC